ncbi:unnamed protein product [Heligmosomoides polygyrus]|uniref:Uncharacterized protein n=1 Tax=Heligmosomoides polygyrus TaxID=6339 RepID=A0A183FFF9_HELPZ|nr:unnamed protein product [Heligmosomoides polygyrus]
METKMLRWTAGVTRMDRIRNDAIRQKFGVAPIADKMREARLRWYGHVLRGKEDSVRKIGLELEVAGKRPRGRPKQRWSDTLHKDMKKSDTRPINNHNLNHNHSFTYTYAADTNQIQTTQHRHHQIASAFIPPPLTPSWNPQNRTVGDVGTSTARHARPPTCYARLLSRQARRSRLGIFR